MPKTPQEAVKDALYSWWGITSDLSLLHPVMTGWSPGDWKKVLEEAGHANGYVDGSAYNKRITIAVIQEVMDSIGPKPKVEKDDLWVRMFPDAARAYFRNLHTNHPFNVTATEAYSLVNNWSLKAFNAAAANSGAYRHTYTQEEFDQGMELLRQQVEGEREIAEKSAPAVEEVKELTVDEVYDSVHAFFTRNKNRTENFDWWHICVRDWTREGWNVVLDSYSPKPLSSKGLTQEVIDQVIERFAEKAKPKPVDLMKGDDDSAEYASAMAKMLYTSVSSLLGISAELKSASDPMSNWAVGKQGMADSATTLRLVTQILRDKGDRWNLIAQAREAAKG